jgi:hypothetical protein
MKFKNRLTLKPREQEERIVKKFTWFPESVGTGVTHWLETIYIRECVMRVRKCDIFCETFTHYEWTHISMATSEEYDEYLTESAIKLAKKIADIDGI